MLDLVADRPCCTDRARRTVKGGEEYVACGIDLTSAERDELAAHHRMMPVEQFAPSPIAQRDGVLCGADHIGKEHCGEDAVVVGSVPYAGQDFFDLVEHAIRVARDRHVVFAEQLDVLRAGNALGDIAAVLDPDGAVPARWMTRVGTRIALSTCRASISAFIRPSATAAPGLTDVRSSAAHHWRNALSPARLGAYRSIVPWS
jgi:hypothetical protein